MNWRAMLLWTALSLSFWFILVAALGFIVGAVFQQAYELWDIPLGQVGISVPIVISLGLFPRLAAGFLLAITLWSLLVKLLPRLETANRRFAGFLILYTIAASVLAWLAMPLNEPFKMIAGILFGACFLLPRYLSSRLSPGVFSN